MKRLSALALLVCTSLAHAQDDPLPEYEEPASPAWSRETAERAIAPPFEKKRLPFCASETYRVPPSERWLCDIAADAKTRCPGLEEACKRPPAAGGFGSGKSQKSERTRRDEEPPFEVPAFVSGIATLIFWIMIVAGIAAIAFAIGKNLLGRAADEAASREGRPPEVPPGSGSVAARVVETDVERLLARARAAAARGDFAQATADAYAALLRHLDGEGLVHLHPSATNGDFVRGLGARPDVQREVRAVVRDVDRVQFGAAPPSPEVYERVMSRVVPLVTRVATLGLLLLSVACSPGDEAASRPSIDSPAGHAVLIAALEQSGASVRTRIEPVAELSADLDMLIVRSDLDAEEWAELDGWVSRGGMLVLGIDPAPAKWLDARRAGGACSGPLVVEDELAVLDEPAKLVLPPVSLLETEESRTYTVARCGGRPWFVEVLHGSGTALVVDDALLTNAALAAGDNAYAVLAYIGQRHSIEIVDQWTGSGTETPFAAVANARLVPALIQVLLLMAVLFVARGSAFGRLREPPERARRAFVDHVRALGRQYAKARASRQVLSAYAGWVLDRLRERVLPSARGSLLAIAESVAARTGRDEREVVRLLVDAEALRDESVRSGQAPDDLKLMRELEGLLSRTGGHGWTSKGSEVDSKR